MSSGFEINSLKKGITLNKNYIIQRMQGNPIYADYVPDNINPQKLSRGFLLSVSRYNHNYQFIAHIDKNLYRELYGISKVQLMQKNYSKWNDFEIEVDEGILNNMKKYEAIDR